jgi:hypothetical protein
MNRRGFTPIIILLLVAGIFVAGFAGYYLYPRLHPELKIITNQSSSLLTMVSSTAVANVETNTPSTQTNTPIVIAASERPVCDFLAIPKTIIVPQNAFLNWNCQNIKRCSITSDKGSIISDQISPSGTLKIYPTAKTVYTLSCIGANSTLSSSNTVTVNIGSGIDNNCGAAGQCE